MSSLTANMAPSEILQFNLNDSTLDLLNAAIASNQVELQDKNQTVQGTIFYYRCLYLFTCNA